MLNNRVCMIIVISNQYHDQEGLEALPHLHERIIAGIRKVICLKLVQPAGLVFLTQHDWPVILPHDTGKVC